MKILSVIVPTYNMEAYLDRCLSSLLVAESLMPFLEVIVVNDGSTDNSLQIAARYQLNYPESYRIIDKKNGNYGSCINVGLSESRGKYFRILDADDTYDTEAFTSFITFLSDCESDLVISPFYFIEQNNKVLYSNSYDTSTLSYLLSEVDFSSVLLHMHSMTFRTDVLRKSRLKLTEGVSYTDIEYCFFGLEGANTVSFFNEVIYLYNASREGQTMSLSSLTRSTHSMYVVSKRLALYYKEKSSYCPLYLLNMWKLLLIRISEMYYHTSIILCAKDDDKKLIDFDTIIQTIPEVNDYLSIILCKHHIHYLRMWRKSKRRYSSHLCQIHHSLWEVIDPIWMRFYNKVHM